MVNQHDQHRYKNMVLDATDAQGQPYTNHPLLFCPFHFMNELKGKANMVFIDGHIVNQVLCIANKRIRAGDELFVDYGTDVDREKWSAAAGSSSVPPPASPKPPSPSGGPSSNDGDDGDGPSDDDDVIPSNHH